MRLSSGQPKVCWTRPGRCFAGSTCHNSLIPMPYFCGSRSEAEAGNQPLGKRAAGALGDQGVLGFEGDSPLKSGLYSTVFGDPHVAGGDAGDRAV